MKTVPGASRPRPSAAGLHAVGRGHRRHQLTAGTVHLREGQRPTQPSAESRAPQRLRRRTGGGEVGHPAGLARSPGPAACVALALQGTPQPRSATTGSRGRSGRLGSVVWVLSVFSDTLAGFSHADTAFPLNSSVLNDFKVAANKLKQSRIGRAQRSLIKLQDWKTLLRLVLYNFVHIMHS